VKLTEKQIDVAVAWWLKALENPKFDTLGKTRGNPEADPQGSVAMAEIMATTLHRAPASESMQRFEEALRTALQREFRSGWDAELDSDYGPTGLLGEVANQARLPGAGIATFPWKATMQFENGGVRVSCGYGAPWEELLASEEAAAEGDQA